MINTLKEFQLLLNRLTLANGRIEKENILKEYASNEPIKNIINFIFNPYIITGISKKKFNKKINIEPNITLTSIEDVMDYIKVHNSGKDIDIANIQQFISLNYEFKNLIESIITKELKIGIQPLTLNKIFGQEFIPLFNVMLAEKYFDNPEKYLPRGIEFTLTEKLDGCRCICIYDSYQGKIEFFTRQGQPIEGLEEIKEDLNYITSINGDIKCVFDGEIKLINKDNLLSKDLYRATVKEFNKDGDKHDLIFNIFDMLPIEDFMRGRCDIPYNKRNNDLYSFFKLENAPTHIKQVETLYTGTDQTQIKYWLDKITSEGGEGVMININNAPYECKRTRNLLKVKKMQTMDLKVVGMEEGEGINKGSLGALKVEFPAPDGNTYIVDVGGGYTLEERKYFYSNPDKIIGKIIEVQYFEVSQNEKGGYALRFPVYLYVREDKGEPSVY